MLFNVILANFFFASSGIAQVEHTKANVREMFPPKTKDLWIHYLSGTIDSKHVVDMIIGTDGHTCKGLYTLRSSNTTFYFDGYDNNHQLSLVELNPDFRMTAFIYGNYDGQILNGEWVSGDKNLVLPIKLELVNSFENYRLPNCKNYQYQKLFSGKVNDRVVRIHLVRDHLNYICHIYDGELYYSQTFIGKGGRTESFGLNNSFSHLNKSWLVLDTSNLEKMDIVFVDETGYEITTPIKSNASIVSECYEYADYHSRLICMRPLSGHKKFDLWMEITLRDWIQNAIKKLKSIEKDEMATRDRWMLSANGWVEIDLFMDDIISGTIYMQSSWKNETDKVSFIYDIKNGKEMMLQDIFESKFDSKEYFRLIVSARIKEINWKAEDKNWVNNQNFNFVTLSDKGVIFRTKFSTIYGEKEIIIPYSYFSQNLKNKNFLKDLPTK